MKTYNVSTFTFLLLSILVVVDVRAQKSPDTADADNHLANYFRHQTEEISRNSLANLGTLEEWKSEQKKLRRQLYEMLGLHPLPEKTDLKVKVTGEVAQKDFVVRNIQFQSSPGLYVTGNLYLPRTIDKPLPAVLYVCGHGRVKKDGISYGNKVHYHHHGSWFARNGYVCLTIDTLQLGEIEGIHHGTYREKMWWWLNRGYTSAGVEAWNCIRAVDYLQSLKEVDPKRIGVTGRSGGGAYSWWIAALDERIQCAVPVAGITDLENHVVDGCVEGHCDCMYMVNTYQWDYPMVAALVAPRPLLISNTDSDRIFPLNGVYRTFEKVRKVYALYGESDKVAFHITAGPHKDTQELRVHAFRWFNHHFKQDDDLVTKVADRFFEPEQLKVLDALPDDQINTEIQETFVPRGNPNVPKDKAEWSRQSSILKWQLKKHSFRGWPEKTSPVNSQLVLRKGFAPKAKGKFLLSEYQFESQKHVPLSLFKMELEKPSLNPKKVLFFVDDRELDLRNPSSEGFQELSESLLGSLNDFGRTKASSLAEAVESLNAIVVLAAPRGMGNRQWNSEERFQTHTRRRFYLLGQSVDGMRVYDVRQTIQAVRDQYPDADLNFELFGEKKLGVIALYASLFEKQVDAVNLDAPTESHREGPFFLNVSKRMDIPHAIALGGNKSTIRLRNSSTEVVKFAKEVDQVLSRDTLTVINSDK